MNGRVFAFIVPLKCADALRGFSSDGVGRGDGAGGGYAMGMGLVKVRRRRRRKRGAVGYEPGLEALEVVRFLILVLAALKLYLSRSYSGSVVEGWVRVYM